MPRDVLTDGNSTNMENRSVFKDCADPPKAEGSAAKLVEDEEEAQLEAQGASCHEPERSCEETRSRDELESSSRRAGVILRHLETNSQTGMRTTGAHSQTVGAPCLLPLRTDEFRYPFSEGLCPDPQVLVILVVWVFVTGDIYGRHWASLICRMRSMYMMSVNEERAIAMPLCTKNAVLSLFQLAELTALLMENKVTCNGVIASSSIWCYHPSSCAVYENQPYSGMGHVLVLVVRPASHLISLPFQAHASLRIPCDNASG